MGIKPIATEKNYAPFLSAGFHTLCENATAMTMIHPRLVLNPSLRKSFRNLPHPFQFISEGLLAVMCFLILNIFPDLLEI